MIRHSDILKAVVTESNLAGIGVPTVGQEMTTAMNSEELQNVGMIWEIAQIHVTQDDLLPCQAMEFVMKSVIPQNATLIMGIEDTATMTIAMIVMQKSYKMMCEILSVFHYTVVLITVYVKLKLETQTYHAGTI